MRHDIVPLVESLRTPSERVVILTMNTQSMTKTVRMVVSLSSGSRFLMTMPDTYFHGEMPYKHLGESQDSMNLACWNIRLEQFGKLGQVEILMDQTIPSLGAVLSSEDKNPNCRFPHSWGAMSFDRTVMQLAKDEMPHTVYLIRKLLAEGTEVGAKVMSGDHFDCGTPTEYFSMLKKVNFLHSTITARIWL